VIPSTSCKKTGGLTTGESFNRKLGIINVECISLVLQYRWQIRLKCSIFHRLVSLSGASVLYLPYITRTHFSDINHSIPKIYGKESSDILPLTLQKKR